MADEKANLKVRLALENANLLQSVPEDFLRLPTSSNAPQQPPAADALRLNGVVYQQVQQYIPPNTRGRLAIKIVTARLTKNYGIVRMDPYVRIRIGNVVYETPTNANGGKQPTWNCTLETYLPINVDSIYLQIFDERSFTDDECVAWSRITLPPAIFNNDTIDEWYPLSGRLGEAQEGVINLVMSFREIDPAAVAAAADAQAAAAVDPELAAAIEASKHEVTAPADVVIRDEDVVELASMFPDVEADVIRAILEEKRGDKQSAATALIELAN
uniref:CUE domain-containing protein n=1 Tax=Panagrellus redivivus TaxID=6233 RepID=A0A7E4VGV7_PANRE